MTADGSDGISILAEWRTLAVEILSEKIRNFHIREDRSVQGRAIRKAWFVTAGFIFLLAVLVCFLGAYL